MSPDRLTSEEIGALDLADLIDASAFQKLMDDFYAVAGIPMSIIDVKGRVLVGVGWQDICTRFHRMQPDSAMNCLESDARLSAGLGQGEYRLYKCKNNMWDVATPIIVAGQHVGNVFTGQFFFEDETIDRELFRTQARKYGFDEKEYMSALDLVPRLSRNTVDRGTSFLLKLADTLSQLGYTNFNLARVLAERDRLTDSLRESRGKLEAALGSMTDAVFISDARGRFLDFNDAFATFHRFRNKDECSKTFAEYPDILDVFMANGEPAPLDQWAVPRALRGESVTNAEYTLRRKDTGETWVGSYSFGPIRDKNDVITGSVVVGRDITERKQAEKAIEQSERRFRALIEKADEVITVLDAKGTITYNIAGASNTLGYTAEELVGRNAFELVHPDDLPRLSNLFQEGVPQPGKVEHAEFRIRATNGSWRWQFAVGTNLLCDPAVGGILVNSRDITERKQAEETLRESESFYRQTLESIPGMVFTTRPDGYCDYQSQQWVDYTGIPMSEHLGNGWSQLLHPDDRSRAFEAWRSAVEGLALYDLEYRVRRHDGAYEWFRVIGRPIRDASGEIVRWFGVAMNIEDLKQVEQALRQLNETLEQRVAQRTELAEGRAKQLQALSMELIEVEEQERQRIAEILHDDLQQVLAAARMQLQAACETIPPEPLLEGVEQLLAESIRKSRRLSHELSPAVLHHSGLVPAMQWLVRQMKNQFGLQVQLESDGAHELESSPLRVFLFRAVHELLFNVVKHAGVKTAKVVLSISGSSLSMTVSDQGQGFSPDILDSYTEPRGFGLLSIRERARHIGGNLVVDSAPGKGSRFALTVPISKDRVDEAERPVVDQQPLSQAGFPVSTGISGLRVIFVDDHSVMRQGLIRLITGQPNIQVVGEAANGREAIERVRLLKPAVVVMDVAMPEMDGIEATRRIKAEFPTVRVIGLSMHEDEQTAQIMLQAGAESFVTKTAPTDTLLNAIYGRR
jgi:PAS domain S-box-containing protein